MDTPRKKFGRAVRWLYRLLKIPHWTEAGPHSPTHHPIRMGLGHLYREGQPKAYLGPGPKGTTLYLPRPCPECPGDGGCLYAAREFTEWSQDRFGWREARCKQGVVRVRLGKGYVLRVFYSKKLEMLCALYDEGAPVVYYTSASEKEALEKRKRWRNGTRTDWRPGADSQPA
jgi:hypothetical protein